MGVRITTWNVNGIRNPFGYHPWREKRTFESMFDALEADLVIFQELKIQRKDLRDDMVMIPGWDVYFSLPKQKRGYSGVAIYTRQAVCAPIRAEEGLLGVLSPPHSSRAYRDMPATDHIGGYLSSSQLATVNVDPVFLDSEGRCVILEFPAFVLFGLYSPANSSGTRDDFRHGFLLALDFRIRNLTREGKRVVVCGDLNVSREETDTANAEENMRKDGISHEDYLSTPNRRVFNQLLEGGKVHGPRDEGREQAVLWDVCREFHPSRRGMFTHWEQKINARPGNFGSRIDFILCSIEMKEWFTASDIQEGLMGSDHCPCFAILKDQVNDRNTQRDLLDILNPPEMFRDGQRIRPHTTKDMPSFSAKLMPEFDKRRSIKDMFGRSPASQSVASSKGDLNLRPDNVRASEAGDTLEGAHQPSANGHPPETSSKPASPARSQSHVGFKRTASSQQAPEPPKKRLNSSTAPSAAGVGGQQTLRGFFKQKESPVKGSIESVKDSSQRNDDSSASRDQVTPPKPGFGTAEQPAINANPGIDSSEDEPVIDPAISKASWSRLMAKPVAPLCGHEEPCKVMKTKKAGFNCGREFWMCQRPLGPSGEKERNSQWRCPTFIWSSDWKPK